MTGPDDRATARSPHQRRRERAAQARIPLATYRLQLRAGMGFGEAAEVVALASRLGASDIYASPLAAARRGSTHGYDVVDPTRLDVELGGEEGFAAFAAALRGNGMGLIVDVVPNHVCIGSPENDWWRDVLENGPGSPFARRFDIDWAPPKPDLANKVLLPVLADQYGRVLERGELRLLYLAGAFYVVYGELALPIAPRTGTRILEPVLGRAGERLGADHPHTLELESVITALRNLPQRWETDDERVRERQREKEIVKRRLETLVSQDEDISRALDEEIRAFNGTAGDARSFDRLEALLAEQAYRLSSWRVAADEINYRRFFDLNDLAAIRVEEPEVFTAVHGLALRLLADGVATGLRIDHVDGLLDPRGYLADVARSAQEALGRPPFVVVEKILERGERPRREWPAAGTTGYEFLNLVNGLFVDTRAARAFSEIWARFTGEWQPFADVLYESKKLILSVSMSSELHVLARRLDRISEHHRFSRDFTRRSLEDALGELVACFPRYRTYVGPRDEQVSEEDRTAVLRALRGARRRNPAIDRSIYEFLGSLLLLEDPEGLDEAKRAERREFVLRFQQLTGPVTARGLEDTAFYRHYPLASLNEVGGSPEVFGTDVEMFHAGMSERLLTSPHALSTTATHDTKRGEDTRLRIDALSEIPEDFERAIRRWHEWNAPLRERLEGSEAPDAREEYLLYQTLLGTVPVDGLEHPEARVAYVDRIQSYMEKALKEAKVHTSWVSPNEAYDRAVRSFVAAALREGPGNRFFEELLGLARTLARAAALSSLGAVVIKVAAPGVPDFYQGTELLDLSLVDPDNRRALDTAGLSGAMDELSAAAEGDAAALVARLARTPEDGLAKLFVTMRALALRRARREVFEQGAYAAVEVAGLHGRHVIAFARALGEPGAAGRGVVAVATRFFIDLPTASGKLDFGDTALVLDPSLGHRFRDAITGRETAPLEREGRLELPLSQLLDPLPVALLESC